MHLFILASHYRVDISVIILISHLRIWRLRENEEFLFISVREMLNPRPAACGVWSASDGGWAEKRDPRSRLHDPKEEGCQLV